jgi:F0F1-type ATP synthase assembly protein I
MSKVPDRTPQSWLRYSHLGLQFVATMVLCVFAGMWADRKLGTTPWLTLVASLLGIASSLWMVIKETR